MTNPVENQDISKNRKTTQTISTRVNIKEVRAIQTKEEPKKDAMIVKNKMKYHEDNIKLRRRTRLKNIILR